MVKILSILIILVLCACTNSQPEKDSTKEEPIIRLSTEGSQVNPQKQNVVEEQEIDQTTSSSQLPFRDFKERWNAVTEEQMSNLYINNLEKTSMDEETIYRTQIGNQLELVIFVSNDMVRQLEINSYGKSQNVITAMLSGWSQIVTILHSNLENHDVDDLFNIIGVGPNGDLTNVKTKSFTYLDLNYEVRPTDNGYTFRVSYDKTH